jgi:hypothetical protein
VTFVNRSSNHTCKNHLYQFSFSFLAVFLRCAEFLPYSFIVFILFKCWGSSVSIVSDYGLDDWGLIPDRAEDFSSSLCVHTGSGTHPASCTMGTGGPFPGGKAQPGHDADHSSPSSAEVKNE